MALPAGLSPATTTFEASHYDTLSYGSIEMVGRLGFAPSSRRLRAGTSLSKFATLVAVCKDCHAKAELNRRGQACEVLADTGISHRLKWSERRVTLPLPLAPEASAPGGGPPPFRLRSEKLPSA